jgi:hypothetical protein
MRVYTIPLIAMILGGEDVVDRSEARPDRG